jgi:mannosyl-oligosaccharide alpha-1,2-mannosidase
MFRMRRFRLFLLVTLLTVALIYELARLKSWDVPDLEGLTDFGFHYDESKTATPKPNSLPPTDYSPSVAPEQPKPQPNADPLRIASTRATPRETSTTSTAWGADNTITGEEFLKKQSTLEEELRQQGQGRLDVTPRPSGKPRAYWKAQKEHFPVQKNIVVPQGQAQRLPQIQYAFRSESSSKKADRVRKQTAIREAFKHAWGGYKTYAMGHDELKPISNLTADTFNGWGATMVDALDTMWIMGLRDEFEEAVKQVEKIDFKTSTRKDIPLFETTIRYLGGLLGAYDISGGKHTILLDKAVELAEVLMGAFDTPNRMPVPYYQWAPAYSSQPHRASTHIVMAELGSLAVEFTRLAQLTKESKYYDAVARVTDALEQWQMKTTYPGVWPVKLDASGCKKPEVDKVHDLYGTLVDDGTFDDTAEDLEIVERDVPDSEFERGFVKRQLDDLTPEGSTGAAAASKGTEKTKEEELIDAAAVNVGFDDDDEDDLYNVDCEPQGLSTEPHSKTHTYSIAAMADSTYEYFPKEYALLGGLKEQYKTMYFDSMETIRKDFLFRPMIQEKRDILFLTKYDISPKAKRKSERTKPIYEATHLGCFAGAMFALGSKVFGIPSDMPLAEKLTDGCVWAYESTLLGIMAEEFEMVPCESKSSCPWNETRWHEWLDPYRKERFEAVNLYNKQQEALQNHVSDPEHAGASEDVSSDFTNLDPSSKRKRDAYDEDEEPTTPSRTLHAELDDYESAGSTMFVPKVALSHKRYVEARISEERLPPGYTRFHSREYKLRPEAIESVFVMYRLTGEEKWREKGWKMFTAIEPATRTASGHAAVKDVTSRLGDLRDSMESFWLAETLKYFYLLFSEESVVSLDEYVLNTEAHPFKLPK